MSYRVLLLEDDPEMRETLEELLQEEGYQVQSTGRGEEAVALATRTSFDLFVSDIRMDGIDGLEAIGRARRHCPGLASLVVSGYASEQETLRALQLHVGGYLRKPFSRQEFLQSVREILQRQRQRLDDEREKEGLRQALDWLMERLCLSRAELPPQLPQLARGLATATGSSPLDARQLSWGLALKAYLLHYPGLEVPAPVKTWLERSPASDCEHQVMQLGHWLQAHWSSDQEWPEVEELPPGLGEPVRQAYQQWTVHSQPVTGGGPSLLALAETLEEAGDDRAAWKAYLQAYEAPTAEPRARLGAALGLARLAHRQQHGEAFLQWSLQLRKLARACGGGLEGRVLSEVGLWFLERQPDQARDWLEQGLALLGGATCPSAAARTRMALRRLGCNPEPELLGSDVELLLSPSARFELDRHWQWLLEMLLRTAPASSSVRRLSGDFEQELAHLVAQERLSPAALEVLLALPELGPGLLQSLLEHPSGSVRQRAAALQQGQAAAGPSASLRLQSLGLFAVHCGSRKVGEGEWRTQKVKLLLAYLAAAWDRRVGEDELLDQFWPESRGAIKRSLYVATTELRRLLRPRAGDIEIDYLRREKNTLFLNLDLPIWHDLREAEELWQQAHQQPDRQVSLYRRLCGLYQGPYLEGHYMDWVVRRRHMWEERATVAARSLADFELGQQHPQLALEWADWALALDPSDLEAHRCKLQSYLQLRQVEPILRHFESSEKLLRREYGIEPSTAMLEMYHRARYGVFE